MNGEARVNVILICYPGVQMSAVLGLTDIFLIANEMAGKRTKLSLPRFSPEQLEWLSGEEKDIDRLGPIPDVLIIPPGLGGPVGREEADPVARWLSQRHVQGSIVASVCSGAFFLAESGLLDGRRATTHWAYADEFSKRFPNVELDVDSLIVDDGDIIAAGGLMSWTDLGLKLVDRFLGSEVMLETAQALLIDPPGREQRFYSAFSPRLTHGDPAILAVQRWLQSTAAKDASLSRMATLAGLEKRTFLRRFQKATELTTSDYIQRMRVGKARELLQFGSLSIEAIAWETGYQDPSAFRRVFAKIVGLTPSEYRNRFGA